MQVGLVPGHIVLAVVPAAPPPKGHSPPFSAHICCGQMAGRIKTPLGREVGLGPRGIVLDKAQLPVPRKGGRVALQIVGSCLLWPNGWMDQHATWHGRRPRPRPHCARWGPSCLYNGAQSSLFVPCLLWPNGWMDQDATWYEGTPRPRSHGVSWGPSFPIRVTTPEFSASVHCGQRVARLSYC